MDIQKFTIQLFKISFFCLTILIGNSIETNGQTFNFTTCGATGKFGPTQIQVNNTYSIGNPLAGKVTINTQGIQQWTVPATGLYKIIAAGAAGGASNYSASGSGRVISTELILTANQVINVVVGQRGGSSSNQSQFNAGGSGGGGSFVFTGSIGGSGLMIASGGGGGGLSSPINVQPGNISNGNYGTSGSTIYGYLNAYIALGGTGGNGGGFSNRTILSGGPGSGWNSIYNPTYGSPNLQLGGTRFIGGTANNAGKDGGFGGGGAAGENSINPYTWAGGGGGYSGGAAGHNVGNSDGQVGGGGGSFITGTNQTNLGLNAGDGYVTITLLDCIAPTINCTSNIIVNNTPGQCGANVTYPPATSTGTSPTITYSKASGSFFPVGTTTVTATATNGCGTASCTFTVTVLDNQPPVIICPANITVNNTANQCGATVTYAATTSDNCGGETVQVIAGLPSGSVFPVGTSTVSLLAVEATGNTAVYNFEKLNLGPINGQDNWKVIGAGATPPSSTVNQVVNTSTSGAYTGSKGFFAADVGGNNRTFSSRVDNANFGLPTVTNTDIVVVEFDHRLAYWGDELSFGFDINNDGDLDDANERTFGFGEASNGGVMKLTGFNSAVLASTTGAGSNIWKKIRLTANLSANGGAGSISFSYMDLTNNGPWISPAGMQNINMGLNPAAVNGQNAANINGMWLFHEAGEASYLDNISFSARKTASCSFTVTVVDEQNPVITCPAAISVNNDLGKCGATVSIADATATDNCPGVTVAGVRSDAVALTADYPVGTTTITWTATDAKGNSVSCDQTVTVIDAENPVITCPPAISVNNDLGKCGASVVIADATATDNCPGVTVAGVRSDAAALTADYPVGTTTITWTATDAKGNSVSCDQTVTVIDAENPVITCPSAISVNNDPGKCGATVAIADATATDNCPGVTVAGVRSDAAALSDDYPVGTTTIKWTATDAKGNSVSCDQTVTVRDNENPVANCKAVTITLANGSASITAASVNNNITDNCGIATWEVSKTSFDCSNIGNNTVTLTVTDIHGNASTCTAVVTVVGEIPTCSIASIPSSNVFTGGVSTNLYLGYGAQSTTLQVSAPASGAPYTYAWSGGTLSNYNTADPVFTATTAGTFTFTVEVTNKYGCKTTCSITICVTDIRVPGTNGNKVYVCHIPPGNPANPQTLSISVNAVPAHVGLHGGDRLGTCDMLPCTAPSIVTKKSAVDAAEAHGKLTVTVAPNPTSTYFTFRLHSEDETPVTIRIVNGTGQVLESVNKVNSNGTVQMGSRLVNGMYFAEFMQGTDRQVIKVLKIGTR